MNIVITTLEQLNTMDKQREIESIDKYGNTPLLLACVRFTMDDIDK
jgi:hypothetical protein